MKSTAAEAYIFGANIAIWNGGVPPSPTHLFKYRVTNSTHAKYIAVNREHVIDIRRCNMVILQLVYRAMFDTWSFYTLRLPMSYMTAIEMSCLTFAIRRRIQIPKTSSFKSKFVVKIKNSSIQSKTGRPLCCHNLFSTIA